MAWYWLLWQLLIRTTCMMTVLVGQTMLEEFHRRLWVVWWRRHEAGLLAPPSSAKRAHGTKSIAPKFVA